MLRMVVGHSDEVDAGDAVEAVVAQCEEQLRGETPTAGLLFSALGPDPEALASGVARAYPGIDLIGSTTMGEMSSVLGFREDSAVLALFVTDDVDITAGLGTGLSRDREGAVREAVRQARSGTVRDPRLCITTPSVLVQPPVVVAHLREALGDDVTVIGGGSAGESFDGSADRGLQFFNGEVFEDAVPVLLFSGPLVYSVGLDSGWRPVGRTGRVTRASDGWALEIDGEPAIRFYERYLGEGARPTPANPLAVFEDDSDGFYLRVVQADDARPGALAPAGGGIPEGVRVQIAVGATEGIFEGTRSAFQRAVKGYPEGAPPEAALLFACAVRKAVLGTRSEREIEIATAELGDVPVAGAYCLGEIAPLEEGAPTRFHNETFVALLLGTEP